MSIDLMSQVWKSDAYSGGKLLVLLALADWASDDGTHIFPKMATLAQKARLSHRQAQNCIKQLRDDGVLEEVACARRGRGTEYRLIIDRVKELHRNNCAANISDETDSAKGVQSAASVGVQSISPPIEEPSVEPSENHHSDAREVSEEGFVPIWAAFQAWPGLSAGATEARARAAYGRMRAELPPDPELIACIAAQGRAYVEENRKRGSRLGPLALPYPHNWLERDRGWKSHLAVVRAEPERIAAAALKSSAARAGLPSSVLAKLNANGIDDTLIDAWFDGVVFEHGPPPRLTVPGEFKRNYIRNNFRGKLERALGPDVVVDLADERIAA